MEPATVSAIISATAGISGVLLGNSFVAIREHLKSNRERDKDAHFLAVLVVAHLDRYIDTCIRVSHDDGTSEGVPAGRDREYHEITVGAPEFDPLVLDVEWKSLPPELMFRILQVPQDQDMVERALSNVFEYADLPEYAEFFRARRHDYAQLGLEVLRIATDLRKLAGLPDSKSDRGEQNRAQTLAEQMRAVEDERAEVQTRIEAHRLKAGQPI